MARNRWWNSIASASASLLMLDYDGTLAPFHIQRDKAFPYPGIEQRLRKLATFPRTRVVLVTGRSGDDLRTIFPLSSNFEMWASHGREHITPEGERRLFPPSEAQQSILNLAQSSVEGQVDDRSIERKLASVAVHWRGLDTGWQQSLHRQVTAIYEKQGNGSGIELLPFEDGLELRATGRTKADAVNETVALMPAETPTAYLGDDRTDEDAFAALPREGLAILVRSKPRPSLAPYWLEPPDDLLEFLDNWISSSTQHANA